MPVRELIEGNPVLVVIDIQGGAPEPGTASALSFMDGDQTAGPATVG